MANKYVSALDCELLLTLPATLYTPVQEVDVTKFITEGLAVSYNFVNEERFATISASDGTAEAFKTPDKRRFIEFTITPASDLDKTLSRFFEADGEQLVGVFFNDSIRGIKYSDEKVAFRRTTASQFTSTPEGATFRLELLSPVVNFTGD